MEKTAVLLFDVDGVLVDPKAYRIGIRKTVNFFSKKMGLGELAPEEREIQAFEAIGVHDVWDLSAVCVAKLVQECLLSKKIEVPAELFAAMEKISKAKAGIEKPDFALLAKEVENESVEQKIEHPPEAALSLLARGLEKAGLGNARALLENILGDSRDVFKNPVTRVFQEKILGEKEFRKTYQLESISNGNPLLKTEDTALISSKGIGKLEALVRKGAKLCVYTGRPSLPAAGSIVGYSPEAEMALELVGFVECPLVGMGKMEWLAKQKGEATEALTKPDFTQAAAAIAAAFSGEAVASLEAAFALSRKGALVEPLAGLKGKRTIVVVFEDSSSGINAVEKAVNALKNKGAIIGFKALGIFGKSGIKKDALEKKCSAVFSDVNKAIEFAEALLVDKNI